MAVLPILTVPDPILRQKALPVEAVDNVVKKLMDDMLESMYYHEGAGLAAVQAGVLKRVIVIDLQEDDDIARPKNFYPLFIANPQIIDKSNEVVLALEGCLSIPQQRIEVPRASSIKFRFLDYNNNEQELIATGWLSRAVQHETDHLDGKLSIDYLSPLKKDATMRKLKKLKKHYL